jgi:hypothetical protein
MKDVDFYLTYAHSARNRSMYISTLIAATAGGLAELLGARLEYAVIVCFVAAVGSEVLAANRYRRPPAHKQQRSIIFSSRRREVIQTLSSAAALLIVTLLRIPRLEAAVIERKLIQATSGPPPYDRANVLIRSVLENNIRLSPRGMEIVKKQLSPNLVPTDPTQPAPDHESIPANLTYADLEGYNIYNATGVKLRLPIKRVVVLGGFYRVDATLYVPWGSTVGQSRTQSGLRADNFLPNAPAIFSFAGDVDRDAFVAHLTGALGSGLPPSFIERDNSSSKLAVFDVTVSNLKQTLDGIIWAEVLFDHCFITYNGGPVLLKNVTFKDCQFSARNIFAQSVVETIRNYENNPVTLTFP